MRGCNMDMYIMNRKTKMLEYISVSKIKISVSASEGVSARSTDQLVWTTGGQGCKQLVCSSLHEHTVLTTFLNSF